MLMSLVLFVPLMLHSAEGSMECYGKRDSSEVCTSKDFYECDHCSGSPKCYKIQANDKVYRFCGPSGAHDTIIRAQQHLNNQGFQGELVQSTKVAECKVLGKVDKQFTFCMCSTDKCNGVGKMGFAGLLATLFYIVF